MKNFDKQLRFGIRKLSIGVVSLSIASFFVVGGNGLVYANESATPSTGVPTNPAGVTHPTPPPHDQQKNNLQEQIQINQ